MSALITLLDFAGYVALLLWGVHMVQTGARFGAALGCPGACAGHPPGPRRRPGHHRGAAEQHRHRPDDHRLRRRRRGRPGPGPGRHAGANVGTTLIVQLLSFDLTSLAPILILAGVWMFRRYPPGRTRDLGRVFIGLGLLLLSLHQLVQLFDQSAPMLGMVLEALSTQPVVAVLLSAIFTWAAHSSVAVVVLVMSLASHHMVAPHVAFALVLGANLGTAINPMIEGVTGDDPAARRLPLGNLLTRALGVLAGLVALPLVQPLMNLLEADPARAVANFHTLFNAVIALVFLPCSRLTPPCSRAGCPSAPTRTIRRDRSTWTNGPTMCRPWQRGARGAAHGRHAADPAAVRARRLQARQPPPHGAGAPAGRRAGQAGERHHHLPGHARPGEHDARRPAAHGRHPGLHQQRRPCRRHRPPRPARPCRQLRKQGWVFGRTARQPGRHAGPAHRQPAPGRRPVRQRRPAASARAGGREGALSRHRDPGLGRAFATDQGR